MTYYVATLARYVLIEADGDADARTAAVPALRALYAEFGWPTDDLASRIRTVRPATPEERELWHAHRAMMAAEGGCLN